MKGASRCKPGKRDMKKDIKSIVENWGQGSILGTRLVAWAEYMALPMFPDIKEKLDGVINTYVDSATDKKTINKIKRDVLLSRLKYDISFSQYFVHGYEHLTEEGRREFVGEREKERYVRLANEKTGTHSIFRDKYQTYESFKPYYHRSVIRILPDNREEFLRFAKDHARFILKYSDEALGKGVQIIDQADTAESMEAFFNRLVSDTHNYIVEELIVQSPEMMTLHPSSVNTVRFATYLKGDDVLHLFSFLRMGSGNGVIDNATAGGFAAAIDMETGIVTSPACREDMTRVLFHPDTGVQIIGMQIPRWQELLSLVDQLAKVVPEQKYVGWDLALTEQGWIMVEGNDDAMITAIQMCERKGLREVFDNAFKN